MAEAILHIGAEKCGSSSLQKFLSKNRAALNEHGILYPVTPGRINHTKLSAYAQDERKIDSIRKLFGIYSQGDVFDFRKSFEKEIKKEIGEKKFKTIVFSNEHCSSRLTFKHEVETLIDFLFSLVEKVSVVLYVRAQDEAIISSYSTQIKSGSNKDFSFPCTYESASFSVKYYQIAELWASVIGIDNLRVVPLHKTYGKVDNAVEDFCKTLNLPSEGFEKNGKENTSLDIYKIWLLKGINPYLPLFESGGFNKRRSRIVSSLERSAPLGPKLARPYEDRKQVLDLFSEENRMLFKKYCGYDDNIFIHPSNDKEEVDIPEKVDPDIVFKMVTDLLKDYDEKYGK